MNPLVMGLVSLSYCHGYSISMVTLLGFTIIAITVLLVFIVTAIVFVHSSTETTGWR